LTEHRGWERAGEGADQMRENYRRLGRRLGKYVAELS
jgi:hypothetical protein